MKREQIRDEVQDIFRDIFDDDTLVINYETDAEDIEDWDSLAQIRLIEAMEYHFNIRFNFEEVTRLKNVGEMLGLIEKKL